MIAAFAGLTVNLLLPNTRTGSRVMGPNSDRYTTLTSRTIESREGQQTRQMSAFVGGYDGLWNHLYQNGGSPFSANSAAGNHSLYIKAVMRNGHRAFAINDPMQRSFEYKTMAQMQEYAAGPLVPVLQI